MKINRYLLLLNMCLIFRTENMLGDDYSTPAQMRKDNEDLRIENQRLKDQIASLEESKKIEPSSKEPPPQGDSNLIPLPCVDYSQEMSNLKQENEQKTKQIADLEEKIKEMAAVKEYLRKREEVKKKREALKECLKNKPEAGFALADGLNAINIGTPVDKRVEYIRPPNDCFVFNSFDNLSAWVEPYGFYSTYQSSLPSHQTMEFTLGTMGVGGCASYEITDEIYLSAAAGFFHSIYKWVEKKRHINGLYFGPGASYRFEDGIVTTSLFCIKNIHQSWDLDFRVDSRFNVTVPDQWILHPLIRMDYLKVWGHEESSSFLYSKIGTGVERKILCREENYITANVDLMWIHLTPLNAVNLKCGNGESITLKTDSKNQLGIGLEIVAMNISGILTAVQYEGAFGASAPMQTGRIRFEWCW